MYRIKRRSAEPNADQASRAAKACKSDGTTTTTSAPAPAAAAAQQQEAAAPKRKPPNRFALSTRDRKKSIETSAPPPGPREAIPEGWVECAKGSEEICGMVAMKSPLSPAYTACLPEEDRWSPINAVMASGGRRVKLIIDLTSTSGYYQPAELPSGVQWIKLPVKDQSVPADEKVAKAIEQLRKLKDDGDTPHGPPIAIVHCTHGTNRTGYFLAIALGMRPALLAPSSIIAAAINPHARAHRRHPRLLPTPAPSACSPAPAPQRLLPNTWCQTPFSNTYS